MKTYLNIKTEIKPVIEPGHILISQGFWRDPIYNRTVVLVMDNDDFGATGIILNKLSNVKVNEVFPDMPLEDNLFYGGPFDSNLIGFIHDYSQLPEAIPIGNGLFWCGDMDALNDGLHDHIIDKRRVKFFAGFVEWVPGELSMEIDEKKWWVDQMTIDELFTADSQTLWAYNLIKGGNTYGVLYEIEDPSLN
jgi:putative transcriptional regulator